MRLAAEPRQLLDQLCAAHALGGGAAGFDRMFRLRPGWGRVMDGLRMKGLVGWSDLRPSTSALEEWKRRVLLHALECQMAAGVLIAPEALAGAIERHAPGAEADKLARLWTEDDEADRAETAAIAADLIEEMSPALIPNEAGDAGAAPETLAAPAPIAPPADAAGEEEMSPASLRADDAGPAPETPAGPAPTVRTKPGPEGRWEDEMVQKRFIEALANCGSVAAALSQIGVPVGSKSGLYALRWSDSSFAAKWDEALRSPAAREMRSSRASLGGAARGRSGEWSAERKAAFLASLSGRGSIADALVAIGFRASSKSAAYQQKKADPAFAAAWDARVAAAATTTVVPPPPPSEPAEPKANAEAPIGLQVLIEVEAYCERTGTNEKRVGAILFRHPGFVPLLRKRGTISPEKVEAVRALLAQHPEGLADVEVPNQRLRVPKAAPPPPPVPVPAPAGARGSGRARQPAALAPVDLPMQRRAEPTFRVKPADKIIAEALAHSEERRRIEAMRGPLTVEEAKLILQRAGFAVFKGAEPFTYHVGTVLVTEAELLERAERKRK